MIFQRTQSSRRRAEKLRYAAERRLGFEPLERRVLFAMDVALNMETSETHDTSDLQAILGSLSAACNESETTPESLEKASILAGDRLVIAIRMPNLESIMAELGTVQILVVYPEGYFSALLPESESKELESLDLGTQSDLVAMRSDSPEHFRLMELMARASMDAVFVVSPMQVATNDPEKIATPAYEIRIEPSSDWMHAPWPDVVSHTFVVDRDGQGSFHASTLDLDGRDESSALTTVPRTTESAIDLPAIEVIIEQIRQEENETQVLVSTIELTSSGKEDREAGKQEPRLEKQAQAEEGIIQSVVSQVTPTTFEEAGSVAMDRYPRETRREPKLTTSKLQPVEFFLLSSDSVDYVLENNLDEVVRKADDDADHDAALTILSLAELAELDSIHEAAFVPLSRTPSLDANLFRSRSPDEDAEETLERDKAVKSVLPERSSTWISVARVFSESSIAHVALACITTATRRPVEHMLANGNSAWELVEKPPRSRYGKNHSA